MLLNMLCLSVHIIDVTVFQSSPFTVDIESTSNVEYKGYLAPGYEKNTFNIGRSSDTGPGDVGNEIINPGSFDNLEIDDPGFPSKSSVSYSYLNSRKVLTVILSGLNEPKERIGAFYVKAVDEMNNNVTITAIKTASQGNVYCHKTF